MGLLYDWVINIHSVIHGIINKCTSIHDNRRIIYNNNHFSEGCGVIHKAISIITRETGVMTTETNQALLQPWETGCDSVTNQGYYICGDGVKIV
jgi:NADH:ubiquinone oxidoreductase subunit F (NADH-binding)